MFQYLKRRSGIDDLEGHIGKVYEGMQFHRQAVTDRLNDVSQCLAYIDDHLLEMKEMVKNHSVVSEQKALDRHTEVMARLGMVLTALEKSTPQYAVSPMMHPISAASQPKEEDIVIPVPRKLKKRTKILHKRMMECLPDSHQEPIHYTVLAHKLLCTPGRLGGQLAALKAQGLVESMGRGLYRKAAHHNQNGEN
jgi:predicted Rossmann fold nucleotide-binding protein DprA/Smf involved in DNA uptake